MDSISPKSATHVEKVTARSKPKAIPKKPAKLSGLGTQSPAPVPEPKNDLKQQNSFSEQPRLPEELPIAQEAEKDTEMKTADPDILESIEEDDDPLMLVDNSSILIEEKAEENKEQREGAIKEPPQASGSSGKSYFQRGKDAASGLASFANKANKFHSQLPPLVQKEATNRLQAGMQRIMTKVQPVSDAAPDKVQDAPTLPTAISGLSGLEVGKDGMIIDGDGNNIGRLVEGKNEDLAGHTIGDNGEILDEDGDLIGRAEVISEDLTEKIDTVQSERATALKSLANLALEKDGSVKNQSGQIIGKLAEGNHEDLVGWTVDENGEIIDDDGDLVGRVEPVPYDENGESLSNGKDSLPDSLLELSILKDKPFNEEGKILDEDGGVLGQIKGDLAPESFVGKVPNEKGQLLDDTGQVIGEAEFVAGEAAEKVKTAHQETGVQETVEKDLSVLDGSRVNEKGEIINSSGTILGELERGDPSEVIGLTVNEKGLVVDEDGNILAKARVNVEDPVEKSNEISEEALDDLPPLCILEGLRCNKFGKILNEDGTAVGKLVEGDPTKLCRAGVELDTQGQFWDDKGNLIGKAEPFPVGDEEERGPFADLDEAFVAEEGWVHDGNGNTVGQVVEGDISKLRGKAVDDDGDILDKWGRLLGRAEPWEESEPEEEAGLEGLEGLTPNMIGHVVDSDGETVARVSKGTPKLLAGRSIDTEGQIWGDDGEVIGRVTLIPEDKRDNIPPFEGTGDLVVQENGNVEDEAGDVVGRIVEGNPRKLRGLLVDDDGDILDKSGNVKGWAKPITQLEEEEEEEEQEEEEEEEKDISVLGGMKVNKLGNIVDENGSVWGRLISGNPKKLVGQKVDAEGQIWDEYGNVVGSVELIPDADREQPEGIFYPLEGLLVTKNGNIIDSNDQTVGRLVEGDATRLKGRAVDEDGEVTDKVGNVIGRAEPWTPDETPRDINPMSGRKVNREGEVRDEDGNLIGRLTEGNMKALIGKFIDDNGYILDNDGNRIGGCTLLENLSESKLEQGESEIEEGEPELSPEELLQKKKEEKNRDLANNMSSIIQQTLDSVEPLCKLITEHIERADRTPRDELDEEQLVKTVKPLIEQAGDILQECKGALRALDPDGQIAASAKARSISHEATPEEYRLADLLKQLSQTISTTIENARQRIADMPYAKKKLNPLWYLLSEPLFQIIAAVGLLLSGVVGLLGNLLDGLGLGGLVRGLLGGLGIDNLLSGLGFGNIKEKLGISR
ncbi:hypothetical protein N7488_000309 [Penicillium malachiteum]|nr:hypothetical protein N7488_000309 [Penicillium malachiteum]